MPDAAPMFFLTTGDAAAAKLPPAALTKLVALRQHTEDMLALTIQGDVMRQLHQDAAQLKARIANLTAGAGVGGRGLDADHPSVKDAQRQLDAKQAEISRLKQIDEIRTARWHAAGAVQNGVEAFLRDAIPGGCEIVEAADIETGDVLKKGEALLVGLERLRLRGRELMADLRRTRSAPVPSKDAKARATAHINALADAGEPAIESLIEHGGDKIAFAEKQTMSLVHNVPHHGAAAFGTETDALGLIAWLHRDALVAKVCALIDAESDDAAALTDEQRETQAAQIGSDLLNIERQECALIWQALRDGMSAEFRADCDPRAILSVELVSTAARPEPQVGSSPQWASRGRG